MSDDILLNPPIEIKLMEHHDYDIFVPLLKNKYKRHIYAYRKGNVFYPIWGDGFHEIIHADIIKSATLLENDIIIKHIDNINNSCFSFFNYPVMTTSKYKNYAIKLHIEDVDNFTAIQIIYMDEKEKEKYQQDYNI